MHYEYKLGRSFMGKLPFESDLWQGLQQIVLDNNIKSGQLQFIGALQKAVIGFYDQSEKRYCSVQIAKPVEIINGTGNISLKDGQPFIHTHVTLADQNGAAYGGHLLPGSKVFACEYYIQELVGPELHRKPDHITGLPLWG